MSTVDIGQSAPLADAPRHPALAERQWTCIATNNPYDLKIKDAETLKELAKNAKAVIIRSVSKISKCVVSKDNHDPIKRLRNGRDMSQSNMDRDMLGGDCPIEYIRQNWEGIDNELERLRVRWGDDRGNPYGFHRIYWASCNNGLHFLPGLDSGWYYQRPADIEILIDAPLESLRQTPQEQVQELMSMDLTRQVLNTRGLWDVWTWDADQTDAFIKSLFGDGPWKELRDGFRDAYGTKATAQYILLHTTSVKSMLNAIVTAGVLEQERAKRDGRLPPRYQIHVPQFGLEVAEMWRSVRLLLLVEGYRLQGDEFLRKVNEAVLRRTQENITSPAWGGETISEIWRNHALVPPGKLKHLRLDDSQDQSFQIIAVIKTKRVRKQTSADDIYTGNKEGTIFTRSFKNGKFYFRENDQGQAKILYLQDGCPCFAIADADGRSRLVSTKKVNDNKWHKVGIVLEQGVYSIVVDDEEVQQFTPTGQQLRVVPDNDDRTTFTTAVSVNAFQGLTEQLTALQAGHKPEKRENDEPDGNIIEKKGYVHGLYEPWFWQPRDRYAVGAALVITDIEEVDAVKENFRVKFKLELSWHHDQLCDWSKRDDEVDCGTDDDGKPFDFDTACEKAEPQPYFCNAVEEPTCTTIVRRRDIAMGRIVSTFYFFGTFYDPVNVHDFPFDTQDFNIKIWLKQTSMSPRRQLVPVSVMEKDIAFYRGEVDNPEWVIYQPKPYFENDGMFKVELIIQRKPDYYLVNVVLPLFLMITLSFCAFATDADSFADRFSVLGGVLLSTVAFRFTYADATPKVSYQTWLDNYVLGANVFLIGLTFAVCMMCIRGNQTDTVDWSWVPDWVTADHMTAFCALVLWALMQEGVVIRTVTAYYKNYAFTWLYIPDIPSSYDVQMAIKTRYQRFWGHQQVR